MRTAQRQAVLADVELPDFGMPTRRAAAAAVDLRRAGRALARSHGRARLRPARRVGRSRAQRQRRLPHRVRSSLRGGGARRRVERGPGAPRRQRVLRLGRGRAVPAAMRALPGPQPARPAARHVVAAGRRSSAPRASPSGSRVGVVGWKTYASRDTIEAPSFLVDELRRATGDGGLVENATDLLIDAADGLRVINEVEQLAAFEWAACQTSNGVRQLLAGLQPGHDRTRGGAAAASGTARRCRAT